MKVLSDGQLAYFVKKVKALIPGLSTEGGPGLLRALSGREDQVLLGTGEWGEYRGGGGGGPVWLEVDGNGDLYALYDDNFGAPNLEYDEGSGNLYALYETEV